LKLYPVGSTNDTMFLGTPNRSMTSSALGSAASELAVENAMRNGSRIADAKVRNGTRIRYDTPPTTMRTKSARPTYIRAISLPSVNRMPRPLPPTVAAIAANTPMGANRIT
jgi:hypothetical protein